MIENEAEKRCHYRRRNREHVFGRGCGGDIEVIAEYMMRHSYTRDVFESYFLIVEGLWGDIWEELSLKIKERL